MATKKKTSGRKSRNKSARTNAIEKLRSEKYSALAGRSQRAAKRAGVGVASSGGGIDAIFSGSGPAAKGTGTREQGVISRRSYSPFARKTRAALAKSVPKDSAKSQRVDSSAKLKRTKDGGLKEIQHKPFERHSPKEFAAWGNVLNLAGAAVEHYYGTFLTADDDDDDRGIEQEDDEE